MLRSAPRAGRPRGQGLNLSGAGIGQRSEDEPALRFRFKGPVGYGAVDMGRNHNIAQTVAAAGQFEALRTGCLLSSSAQGTKLGNLSSAIAVHCVPEIPVLL